MSNNGLKNKNELLQKIVGNTEVLCNVTKYHGNISLKINLLSTLGVNSTDFFLYYNSFNNTNVGFGTGFTCNFYKKIIYSNSKYLMTTYDGLEYEFDYVEQSKYYNQELNQIIEEHAGALQIKDDFGNVYNYLSTGNYPTSISLGQNDYEINYFVSNGYLTRLEIMSGSRLVSTIYITYTLVSGSYYATQIRCTKPNNTYNISYVSSKISAISSSITGQNDLLSNMSYTHNSDYLIVKDNITSKRCKVEFDIDSQYQTYIIDKIEEYYYINNSSIDKITTLLAHTDKYVKIYDNYGYVEYLYYDIERVGYFFDNKQMLRKCVYDNYGRVIGIYNPIKVINKNLVGSVSLIKNGYFEDATNNLQNWTLSGDISYNIIPDSSRPLASLLGDNYLKIKNIGFGGDISQTISARGSEVDSYTLVLWLKDFTLGNDDVDDYKIELIYYSKKFGFEEEVGRSTKTFSHKNTLSSEWYPVVLDLSENKSFDELVFKITILNTNYEVGIDGICLTRNKVKCEASYYAYGKKEKEESGDELINYIHNYHDTNNGIDKLGMIIDGDGKITRLSYDSDCNNITEINKGDLVISRTYDTTEKGNLVKEEITSNDEKIVKEYTYTTSKDYIQTEIGYDDSVTQYYTDEARGNVYNVGYPNGNTSLFNYNYKDQVEKNERSGVNFLKDLNYSYENDGQINEVIMSNNYKYDFDYTNSKISQIKVNNQALESLSYLTTYPYGISHITMGTNGDDVKLEYNQRGLLSSVSYKLKGESVYILKYGYFYYDDELLEVRCYSGAAYNSRKYSYNATGEVIKIYDENNPLDIYCNYLYDNSVLSFKDINNISSKRIEVPFCSNRMMLTTKDDLRDSALYQTRENKKYYTFFNNTYNASYLRLYSSTNKSQDITKVITCSYLPSRNNLYGNYYVSLNANSSFMKYLFPYEYYDSNNSVRGCSFGFLFIPHSLTGINTLFSVFDDNGSSRLVVYRDNNKFRIIIYDSTGYDFAMYQIDKKCEVDMVNYFGLSYSLSSSGASIKISCVFNNEKFDFDPNPVFDTLIFNNFSIGSYKNDASSKSSFDLYSVMAMPVSTSDDVLSVSELIKNYHLLKDIYETPTSLDDLSWMDTFTKDKVTNLTDFVPLTNSFVSRESIKPIYLNRRYDEECVRNKYFKYIDSIKQSMLKMDGINLVYDFNLGNTFTIAMNVMFSNIYNTDYIYKIISEDKFISLYITNNTLYLGINTTIINTHITVTTNTLYFISLGIDLLITSDSLINNQYRVRVVCNDECFDDTFTYGLICNPLLIIGSKGMNEEVDHFMDGYINSLCYKDAYMSEENIGILRNQVSPLRTETKLDGFGRIRKSRTLDGTLKLEKSISYKQIEDTPSTNKDTMFVSSEEVKDHNNNTLLQRSYTYGTNSSYGNITEVRENNSLINQYYYNEKGYLTESYYNNLGKFDEFHYDNNGNMTQKLTRSSADGTIYNDILFYYDTTWPDRLVQVGSKRIEYDSDSIGCPIHYGYFSNNVFTSGITYSWRCSKLIGLVDSINNKSISYDYDEEGRRTWKTVNNVSHYYYYEGDRLLLESFSNNRLDFLYDENNNLVGFDYTTNNSTNRYYYIKNILGDVIKIIDNSGTVVVSYVYSSYGEILSITGTLASTIGAINPFRYRSYYYDTDTNMYYLKTRYYNPEWCRFISSDNISYLEYDNPLGVNLFSYCGNNPVMYNDPEGTAWYHWLIGGIIIGGLLTAAIFTGGSIIVAAAVGSIIGSVTSAAFDGMEYEDGELKINWEEASKGFLSGAISGAITGMIGEIFTGMNVVSRIMGNSLANVLSYTLDGIIRGKELTLDDLMISLIFGAVSGIPNSNSFFTRTLIRSTISSLVITGLEKTIEEIQEKRKSRNRQVFIFI